MILIRHGQSHFNLHFGATRVDPGIVDPGLTDEGSRQVAAAADGLRKTDLRRIISSPYTRTLESAAILAEALGLGFVETGLLAEELGRASAPGPLLATVTQFVPAVREVGGADAAPIPPDSRCSVKPAASMSARTVGSRAPLRPAK